MRNELEGIFAELKWRAYAKDPALFFEECLWIPSQQDDRGRTRFELFDYQREDMDTFLNNRFVVVLKGRQLGLSTLVGALALWRCLFRPGSVILWVSNNQDNANKAVQMLDVMWHFLPEWVQDRSPERTVNQAGKKEWEFADGMTSRIRAFAGTATATASETASIVILDEFALVDPHLQDGLLKTADPTTDAGGSLWMVSTARGGYNRFAQTYWAAQRGESRYVPVFHPWMESRFVNPLANRLRTCETCGGDGLSLTEEDGGGRRLDLCPNCVDTTIYEAKSREWYDKPWMVHSEYPATVEEAFRESGNPVFRDLPLEEECETHWVRGFMHENAEGKAEFVEEPTGPMRLREDVFRDGPDVWREHVMFVDPAEGVGGDYTACQVLTWDDDALPTILAWWHSNDTEAVLAAREFGLIGRFFNDALLAVETTGGFGGAMLTELNVHQHYPNLYVHVPTDARRRQRSTKLGLPMSHGKRPMVIDRLIEYMNADKQIGAIYPLLRQELATFVKTENGRMEADVGCHDDLVMALAGALWVLVEDTTATEPPSHEEVSKQREIRTGLTRTWQKIDQARAHEAEQNERWERRMQRRAEARQRHAERRKSRQRAAV